MEVFEQGCLLLTPDLSSQRICSIMNELHSFSLIIRKDSDIKCPQNIQKSPIEKTPQLT